MIASRLASLPLILAALVGAGTCLITQTLLPGTLGSDSLEHTHEGPDTVADYHEWMHAQLQISDEQNAVLASMEKAFLRQSAELIEQIRAANAELGDALQADRARTPRVHELLSSIHAAQGALQEATVDHFLEMKPHLSEAQFERLLTLMTNALHGVPHSHLD